MSHPNGTKGEFEGYYKALTEVERQVGLFDPSSCPCSNHDHLSDIDFKRKNWYVMQLLLPPCYTLTYLFYQKRSNKENMNSAAKINVTAMKGSTSAPDANDTIVMASMSSE